MCAVSRCMNTWAVVTHYKRNADSYNKTDMLQKNDNSRYSKPLAHARRLRQGLNADDIDASNSRKGQNLFIKNTRTTTHVARGRLQRNRTQIHGFYRVTLFIRGICYRPVSVCLSVCLSDATKRTTTKTASHDSPGTLIYQRQRYWWDFNGITPIGASNTRWVEKFTTFDKTTSFISLERLKLESSNFVQA